MGKRKRPRRPAKFSLPLVSEAQDLDPVAERVESRARRALTKVGCDHGCSDCCYQQVSVSAPELFRIYAALRALPEKDRTRIAERARSAEDALRGKRGKSRVDTAVPCPLLDDDGRCSVYEARPMPCRTLWVEDESRSVCAADFSDDDTVLIMFGPGMETGMNAQARLRSHPEGWPPFDLHKAIGPLLRTPDARALWKLKGPKMLKRAVVSLNAEPPGR